MEKAEKSKSNIPINIVDGYSGARGFSCGGILLFWPDFNVNSKQEKLESSGSELDPILKESHRQNCVDNPYLQ